MPDETVAEVGVGSSLTIELIKDESTDSGRPVLDKVGIADCLLKMDDSCIDSIDSKTPDGHGAEGRVRRGDEVTSVVRIDDSSDGSWDSREPGGKFPDGNVGSDAFSVDIPDPLPNENAGIENQIVGSVESSAMTLLPIADWKDERIDPGPPEGKPATEDA
jgi:hypothetical protein